MSQDYSHLNDPIGNAPEANAPKSVFNSPEQEKAFQRWQEEQARREQQATAVTTEGVPSGTDYNAIESEAEKVYAIIRDFLAHKFGDDIRLLDNTFTKVFPQ